MSVTPMILCFAFVIGAIWGSFLNVVGLRFLKGESIVWRRSYCYHCDTMIQPYDNIPILSWLILGGKCRQCRAGISWQYPAVELMTALLFVATVWQFGMSWATLGYLFLICNLVVILITDFREQYIFDINSLGLIPVGLVFSFFNLADLAGFHTFQWGAWHWVVPEAFVSALIAVVGAFLIFFCLNLFSKLFIGKAGFGEGDSRLLMGLGAFFGLPNMVLIFILSVVIQVAIGLPMLMVQWVRHRAYSTLGFFLTGLVLALLPYALQHWIHDVPLLLGITLVFGLVAMIFAFLGLRRAKDLPIGLHYLPFGPAIVVACLAVLFFEPSFHVPISHVLPWLIH